MVPKAAPIMIPTAISMTFPRIANSLNSFSIGGPSFMNEIFIRHARKPQAFKPGDEWHPFEAEPGGTWRSGANSDMIWLWPDTRLGLIRNTVCSTTWCGYRNIVGGYCEAKWSSA